MQWCLLGTSDARASPSQPSAGALAPHSITARCTWHDTYPHAESRHPTLLQLFPLLDGITCPDCILLIFSLTDVVVCLAIHNAAPGCESSLNSLTATACSTIREIAQASGCLACCLQALNSCLWKLNTFAAKYSFEVCCSAARPLLLQL